MNDTNSTEAISLEQRRRLRRAADFLKSVFGVGRVERLYDTKWPFSDIAHLPEVDADIGVTRAPAPKFRREMTAHTAARQKALIIGRLRDPVPGLCELSLDLIFRDGGSVLLPHYHLATISGRWWTVGLPGEVLIKLQPDGLVPTLSEPWSDPAGRETAMAAADRMLSDFVWDA
jgi:hypothetical protein